MKIKIIISLLAMIVALPAMGFAASQSDSRETVAVRAVFDGGKTRGVKFIKVCPHQDKLAAGKCKTDIWGRMRCTG